MIWSHAGSSVQSRTVRLSLAYLNPMGRLSPQTGTQIGGSLLHLIAKWRDPQSVGREEEEAASKRLGEQREVSPPVQVVDKDDEEAAAAKDDKSPNDVILGCVQRALSEFGSSVPQVIYWYMEKNFGLRRELIISHPEELMNGIESLFGQKGSSTVIRHLKTHIITELGLEDDGLDLAETIRRARNKLKESER